MSEPKDDQRWFDVLAGKAAPANEDERQAASLRNYFELREQHDEQVDPAVLQRVENMVMASLAAQQLQQATQARQAAPQGLWQRFSNWLVPPGGGHPERYGLAAVVALAFLAVPVAMNLPERNTEAEMKRLDPPGGVEALVSTPEPAREARALLTVLQQNGLPAAVRADGEDQVVSAQIPLERLAEVSPALASIGLATPPDGRLQVRFKKRP